MKSKLNILTCSWRRGNANVNLYGPKKDLSRLSLGFHKCLMWNDYFQLLYIWKTENRVEHLGILTCLKYKSQMNHGFMQKAQMKWNQLMSRIEPRTYCRSDMIPWQNMHLKCVLNFQQYKIISIVQVRTGYHRARSIILTASSATLAFEVQSFPKPVLGLGFFAPLPGTR